MRGQGQDFSEDDFEFDQLIELERADAVLDGRDPTQADAVVVARVVAKKLQKETEKKALKVRQDRLRKQRAKLLRAVVTVCVLAGVGAASVPAAKALLKERARARALTTTLDTRLEHTTLRGFRLRDEWTNVSGSAVSADIAADTCAAFVAVAEGQGSSVGLSLEREKSDPFSTKLGALAFCACEAEKVSVKVTTIPIRRAALRWLSAPMRQVGGIDVLLSSDLGNVALLNDEPSHACAKRAFEGWTRVGQNGLLPAPNVSSAPWTAALQAEGLRLVGLLTPDKGFGVIRATPNTCFLSMSQEPTGVASVRSSDASNLVPQAARAIAFCHYGAESVYSIWKDRSQPSVAVLEVASARVGGTVGIVELAERHGLSQAPSAVSFGGLEANSRHALIASMVPDASIFPANASGLPGKLDSRVAAFSLVKSALFMQQAYPKVTTDCMPDLPMKDDLRGFVCAQARGQPWQGNGLEQGAVEGRHPFWMSVLAEASEPQALKAISRLLAFARRMTLLGFEASTIDGVTDTDFGAVITGRAGRSNVVALGLTAHDPWIHPLSMDKPWKLDGKIPVLDLPEDMSITMRAATTLGSNKAQRRVVAFRR